jgi:hypothetical protein
MRTRILAIQRLHSNLRLVERVPTPMYSIILFLRLNDGLHAAAVVGDAALRVHRRWRNELRASLCVAAVNLKAVGGMWASMGGVTVRDSHPP